MTTTTTTNKARYEGNGVTNTFAFSGRIFQTSDLQVSIITRATDALVETLTETTDYTVTINGDESASVTVVSGKIPTSTQDIQLLRVLPKTQTLDLPTGTRFPAESVENSLDKITAITQDLTEEVDRSIKLSSESSLSAVELPSPVASEVIGWNASADDLTTYSFAELSGSLDVVISGLTLNDYLVYDGVNWVNQTLTATRDEIFNIDVLSAMGAFPAATSDYIAIYDTSSTSNLKITPQNFYKTINGLTADSSPDRSADYVVTYDASAATSKKVLLEDVVLVPDASTSQKGIVELATAAEVESETAGKVPTADILANHPGIAKAACLADGTGTPSFNWNHNFSSITRASTGTYDFTMSVTFASATSYSVVALSDVLNYARVENKTTTGFRLVFQATGITSVDIDDINIAVFGDLA